MLHPNEMDAERWHAVESAFATVMALEESERERWFMAREREDPALAGEVRALLSAAATPGALDRLAPQLGSLQQLLAEVETSGSHVPFNAQLPTHIGPYVVAREIGRGGMGVVCQAHDPRLGRHVAIKVFQHALGATLQAEQRVLAEARAASALDHPNICTIYDVGTLDDGRPYLAMAYYPGGTLAERITSGPMPAPEAGRIALQVAEALACAHDAGIVHRDVKPRNVAFGDRGEAKLLDFGVALLRDQSGSPGSAGTPAYMAPEQVRGEAVDARADVWALGLMLFEMLTGQRPFRGQDRHELTAAILHDDAPDVRSLRSNVPAALAALVSRALRKAPNERPASAAEAADALRAVLATVDGGELARLRTRRRRIAVIAITGAGLLGAVFLRDAWREPPAATREVALSTSDPSVQDLVDRARERDASGGPQGTEEAIRLLHTGLSRDSTYAPVHALLARAYARSVADGMSRQGDSALVDSAQMHAWRAISLAPASPLGYAALGFVHASMVNYADAVPQYLRALELDPRHPQTMMDLARSYMALDRFDEAVTWQERALALDPLLPGARVLAIGRYTVWELFDHAWRHIDVGLRHLPTDVEIQAQAMLLDLRVGDTTSARRRLDAMRPLLAPLLRDRLGIAFELAVKNTAGARAHVDRIAGTASNSQDFLTYGMVYRVTGDRALGDSLVRLRIDALQADDRRTGFKSTQVAAALAHAYSVLGNRDSSVAHFARWEALGGVMSRLRLGHEPGWETLLSDPRSEPISARMEARFQAGRAMMRARLAREFPRDTSSRAHQVPLR